MGQNRFTPIRYDLVSPTNLEYRREYAVYVFFPLPLEIIPLAIVSIINNIINNIMQHSIAGQAKLHSIPSIKISNETIQDHRSVSNKYFFARVGLFRIVINLSGISIR